MEVKIYPQTTHVLLQRSLSEVSRPKVMAHYGKTTKSPSTKKSLARHSEH